MRIESLDNRFVIVRGNDNRRQYFSFYVDHNRSSWSRFSEQARKHETRTDAESALKRLRAHQRDQREALRS